MILAWEAERTQRLWPCSARSRARNHRCAETGRLALPSARQFGTPVQPTTPLPTGAATQSPPAGRQPPSVLIALERRCLRQAGNRACKPQLATASTHLYLSHVLIGKSAARALGQAR